MGVRSEPGRGAPSRLLFFVDWYDVCNIADNVPLHTFQTFHWHILCNDATDKPTRDSALDGIEIPSTNVSNKVNVGSTLRQCSVNDVGSVPSTNVS